MFLTRAQLDALASQPNEAMAAILLRHFLEQNRAWIDETMRGE